MQNTIHIPINGTLGFVDMLNKVREHFGIVDLDHLTIWTHSYSNPKSGSADHYLVVCDTQAPASEISIQDKIETAKTLAYGMGLGATLWVHDEDFPATHDVSLKTQGDPRWAEDFDRLRGGWREDDDKEDDIFEQALTKRSNEIINSLNESDCAIEAVVVLPKT